jgi:hypothetical protein
MYVKNTSPAMEPTMTSPPIPGSGPIAACAPYVVLLENGDLYTWSGNPEPWVYVGALVTSIPVPSHKDSWGGVKARYRQGAAAAPQDK